jgi:hypothetical protein
MEGLVDVHASEGVHRHDTVRGLALTRGQGRAEIAVSRSGHQMTPGAGTAAAQRIMSAPIHA